MISINEHIRYLLTRLDCVVVPGLGAFIARTEGAHYDESTGLFVSPCRRVGFNARVSHDDGVLANSLVRREGVSYESARTLIANEVAMLRSRLDSCGVAMLPRLGTLSRVGGTLLFTPAATSVADGHFLGLQPVAVSLASAAAPAVGAEEEATDRVIEIAPRRGLRWMRVAASVALLVGLGFTLSTPVLVDRTGLTYASVSAPAVIKPAHRVHLPAADTAGRSLFCVIPDSAEATARVQLPVAVPERHDYKHYLIVASCETRRRADRFVSRHSADRLNVLEADGRFRVYIKASDSEADVAAPRADVALRYPGAWIYSR